MCKQKVYNNWTKKFNYVRSTKVLPVPKVEITDAAKVAVSNQILRYLGFIAWLSVNEEFEITHLFFKEFSRYEYLNPYLI